MNITSRTAWGAQPAKNGVQSVNMSKRTEFVIHHSGAFAAQSVAAIQHWCMADRGFLDIDYNFLIRGTTGEIYEGRGWNAVGSHCVGHNTSGLGVCVIGVDDLSDAAKESVRWLYAEAARRAGHPLAVRGHLDLAQTDCPGKTIQRWLRSGQVQRPLITRDLELTDPAMQGDDVRDVQRRLRVGLVADGIYGPLTAAAVKSFQATHHLTVDGIVGPATRAALHLG